MRKALILLSVLLYITFLFFRSTLNYYFISDDFFHISFTHLIDTFRFYSGLYHYNPVFWLLMWSVRTMFGVNPKVFHLTTVLLHLANTGLVFLLAQKLLKKPTTSLVAAGVFAVFFSHYEVVYWITGISISLMVFFYLLALLVFMRFTDDSKPPNYLIFLVLFILSLLSHEYAVSLAVITPFYGWLFGRNLNKSTIIKLSLIPLGIISILLVLKILFAQASLVVTSPSPVRFLASVIKSFLFLFIPLPHIINSLPKPVLTVGFFVLITFLIRLSLNNKLRQFLLLWITGTALVFSLTSLPQARYFYLSAVPTILLIISLLQPAKSLKTFSLHSKISHLQLAGGLWVLMSVFSGITFLQGQKQYWIQNTRVTQNILTQFQKLYPNPNPKMQIYAVNFPDSINGPPWQAYVFRRGLEEALRLRYRVYPGNISYFRTQPLDGKVREDTLIDEKELHQLSPNNIVVFAYHPATENIEILNKAVGIIERYSQSKVRNGLRKAEL